MTDRDDDSGEGAAEELLAEYVRRIEAGETLALEQICAEHPAHADELRSLAAGLDLVRLGLGHDRSPSAAEDRNQRDIDPETLELIRTLRTKTDRFERYGVRGALGRGGMGEVLRVFDRELGREVAMKVIHSRVSAGVSPSIDLRILARFAEEAKTTARVAHPSIVPIHDIGSFPDGRLFYTMHLVPGVRLGTIFEKVRSGEDGWTLTRVVGILLRACEAIGHAHEKGVIHRDLKPSNIMVGSFDQVYVVDWGLARSLERDPPPVGGLDRGSPGTTPRHASDSGSGSHLTLDGQVLGTPAYMAPEQALGDATVVGPRSDVYSFGTILYELFSGAAPYVEAERKQTQEEMLQAARKGAPRELSRVAHSIPAPLVAICERAMARQIENRYPSMADLADDLRAYLENRVVSAHQVGPLAEAKMWIRRNRALAASLLATFLVIVAAAIWLYFLAERARSNADDVLRTNALLTAQAQVSVTLQALREFRTIETRRDWLPHDTSTAQWWLENARTIVDGEKPGPDEPHPLPGLAGLERHLAAVRSRGTMRHDPGAYPRAADLEHKQRQAAWLRRLLRPPGPAVSATAERAIETLEQKLTVRDMNLLAWFYVDPRDPHPGHEFEALALAQEAFAHAQNLDEYIGCMNTLAWSYFHTGEVQLAVQIDEYSVKMCTPIHPKLIHVPRVAEIMSHWDAASRERDLLEYERDITDLTRERDAYATYIPSSRSDAQEHEQLLAVIDDVRQLAARLDTVAASIESSEARARWESAAAAIARMKGFEGVVLTPQVGLLPIGPDPDSGLWAFAHLASGVPAQRGNTGLERSEDFGLVFVLVPGSEVVVPDPIGLSHATRSVLPPFFISKYEMTSAQWASLDPADENRSEHLIKSLPVVNATWSECAELLARSGTWLELPSQTQWMYASLAGSRTAYWPGNCFADLIGKENVNNGDPNVDHSSPAPVGEFAPNPFGLYDMLGNVSEYSRDNARDPDSSSTRIDSRGAVRHRDKTVLGPAAYHLEIGNAFTQLAEPASASVQSRFVGLRPVRPLLP